jgi:subtilisin-like proprotein convertase family protein
MTRGFHWGCRAALMLGVMLIGLLTAVPSVLAATFTNTTPITINDDTTATPYPSNITVSGLAGPISDVNFTITGLQHTAVQDVGIALVAPNGLALDVMANVGFDLAPGVTYTFDDEAPAQFPFGHTAPSGSYQPTVFHNRTNDFFPSPCLYTTMLRAGPEGAAPQGTLSAFKGLDPNGNWQLCVGDFSEIDTGSIDGGWSLDVTTSSPSSVGPTGKRAAALKRCKKAANKKGWSKAKLKKCKKRARKLPV